MTTWYGKTASKQMEQLLETRPKLHQLLLFPDFLQELKSFNSKLLEYITNTSSLIGEAIDYFTLSPSHLDSSERKFKYPLLSICMVEM